MALNLNRGNVLWVNLDLTRIVNDAGFLSSKDMKAVEEGLRQVLSI